MFYGYARVINMGQARESNSLEAQESALQQADTERIFWDVFSRKPERRLQSFVLNMGMKCQSLTTQNRGLERTC